MTEKIAFKPLVWTKNTSERGFIYCRANVYVPSGPEEDDYIGIVVYELLHANSTRNTHAVRILPDFKEWESKTGDIEELKRLCEEDYQEIMNRIFHEIQKLRS